MGKKKRTIVGLVFRCEGKPGKPCGKEFRIGSKGVDACLIRARKHAFDKGHQNIAPVNPPKGLTYKSLDGAVEAVYDGKDLDAFIAEVKSLCMQHHTHMVPQLKLA
jgi:hypothetical protein